MERRQRDIRPAQRLRSDECQRERRLRIDVEPQLGRNVATTTYDPSLLNGWGKRPYDWETQAGIQHEYGDRLNQLDGRLSKTFKFGSRGRAQVMFDLYNLLNVGPVLVLNTTYGAAWQTPTAILPGRLAKFGVRIDF